MNTRFFAGGFLYNKSNHAILLHNRDSNTKFNPNKWAFFGGLSENEETPEQCFARELNEEIGLRVLSKDIKYLLDYYNEENGNQRYIFYVESEISTDKLLLGEGAGFKWISLKNLNKYELTKRTVQDLDYFTKMIALNPLA